MKIHYRYKKKNESKEGGSLAHEQEYLDVERYSTSKMKEDEETSISKIEGEDRPMRPEWEEPSTSRANEKVCATPTTLEGIKIFNC